MRADFVALLILPSLLAAVTIQDESTEEYDEDMDDAVEIGMVKNDKATIAWKLPPKVAAQTTRQRLMITLRPGATSAGASTYTVNVKASVRTYTFENLAGNTSYRASVEAFGDDRSLWYASNELQTSLAALDWLSAPKDILVLSKSNSTIDLTWTIPYSFHGSSTVLITQHFVKVYEFMPVARTFIQRSSHSVPIPKNNFIVSKLNPGTVYNITIQSGTSFGYGQQGWVAVSTLVDNEGVTLNARNITPNSIILQWPLHWMAAPNSKCTVHATSLTTEQHGLETELKHTGSPEVDDKNAVFEIRDLRPSTAYNVSVTTAEGQTVNPSGRFSKPLRYKTIWAVFATLVQGEYTVPDPRIVLETEYAASIVWHPLQNLGDVTYQIRHSMSSEDSAVAATNASTDSEVLSENQLRCPKVGCTNSLCALMYNLPRHPRDLSFEIRARVDGMWNKWTPVHRRVMKNQELNCIINPPHFRVQNVDVAAFQREIDLASGEGREGHRRFLVVIDTRDTGKYSTIDITKLYDKVTADFERLPYYVTGALTSSEVKANIPFTIGDGRVHGGYLNYPLPDRSTDPRWSLVPLTQAENELIEPRLRTCGFDEKGKFDCDLTWEELLTRLPWWAKISSLFLMVLILAPVILCCYCVLFKCRSEPLARRPRPPLPEVATINEESNLMYYSGEGGQQGSVTQEYVRRQQRSFNPRETEERREFMTSD